MIPNLLNSSKIRFLIGGIIAVAINLVVIVIFVEIFGFKSPFLKNIANIISMEIGTITSFCIYRFWVWEPTNQIQGKQVFNQLLIYHLTLGTGIVIRSLIIFPTLNWLKVNYVLNVAIGILIFTILNYFINQKIFKA
jgi:dolichol-phosphate mannosyltransferase